MTFARAISGCYFSLTLKTVHSHRIAFISINSINLFIYIAPQQNRLFVYFVCMLFLQFHKSTIFSAVI